MKFILAAILAACLATAAGEGLRVVDGERKSMHILGSRSDGTSLSSSVACANLSHHFHRSSNVVEGSEGSEVSEGSEGSEVSEGEVK